MAFQTPRERHADLMRQGFMKSQTRKPKMTVAERERRQNERKVDHAVEAFLAALRKDWPQTAIKEDSQYYYSNTGAPGRLLTANTWVKGDAVHIVVDFFIEYGDGAYRGYFKTYEPFGKFGQGLSDAQLEEGKELGLNGEIAGSLATVVKTLAEAYTRLRTPPLDGIMHQLAASG